MFGLVKFLEVKCYCSENLNKFFWLFALCRGFLGCLVIKMGDTTNLKDEDFIALGAKGVIRPDKESIQIVLGTQSESVAEGIRSGLLVL